MEVKVRKARNLLWACRSACRVRWGLGPKVVHWLYVAIVRPNYLLCILSMVAWLSNGQCQEKAKQCQERAKVQRLACLGVMEAIRTTPTGAMEVLVRLPPLDLVIQGEARSAVQCLWSLGCWSYLHPQQGHSCILTQIQKSDPTFNMGVNDTKPVFNLEPKYRVTMLTREEWTRVAGTPPTVKGLVWYTDGSRTAEGTQVGGLWAVCK
jgi:hypothetical protein